MNVSYFQFIMISIIYVKLVTYSLQITTNVHSPFKPPKQEDPFYTGSFFILLECFSKICLYYLLCSYLFLNNMVVGFVWLGGIYSTWAGGVSLNFFNFNIYRLHTFKNIGGRMRLREDI